MKAKKESAATGTESATESAAPAQKKAPVKITPPPLNVPEVAAPLPVLTESQTATKSEKSFLARLFGL